MSMLPLLLLLVAASAAQTPAQDNEFALELEELERHTRSFLREQAVHYAGRHIREIVGEARQDLQRWDGLVDEAMADIEAATKNTYEADQAADIIEHILPAIAKYGKSLPAKEAVTGVRLIRQTDLAAVRGRLRARLDAQVATAIRHDGLWRAYEERVDQVAFPRGGRQFCMQRKSWRDSARTSIRYRFREYVAQLVAPSPTDAPITQKIVQQYRKLFTAAYLQASAHKPKKSIFRWLVERGLGCCCRRRRQGKWTVLIS